MASVTASGVGFEWRGRRPRAPDVTAATLALRLRPAGMLGPALGRAPFPVLTIVLSALGHAAAGAALLAAVLALAPEPSKTYVVNLVPAVAAVGSPTGRAETPRRTEEPPPRVASVTPPEPAPRPKPVDAPRPAPPTPAPVPRELPAREVPVRPAPAPELPARALPHRRVDLPDRTAPARPPSLPRAGERELPPVASAPPAARSLPALPPRAAPPAPAAVREAVAPAPAPRGRPSGSASGSGALTLNVGDFPFAWYLRVIERKIHETWRQPLQSRDSQEAVAVFEIGRDGQVRRAQIERTSGDLLYDQAALRAVQDANPFPPLPEDFKEPLLRVHLAFTFRG